jgi:hypothetical protein
MAHETLKTSTILISSGDTTKLYRSVEEVPDDLRRKLIESTSGTHSAVVLIADEGGRREIARSLQGKPTALQSSFLRNMLKRMHVPVKEPRKVVMSARLWAEIGLVGGIGLCLYLLTLWR